MQRRACAARDAFDALHGLQQSRATRDITRQNQDHAGDDAQGSVEVSYKRKLFGAEEELIETLDMAFSAMLATAPALTARQMRLAVRALTQSAEAGALELIPGAIFVGARVASVSEPTLFLGINPRGIPFPKATQPARVTVAALTPERGPGPSQLLADVAPLISNAERIHALCQAADVDSVVRSFRFEDRDTVAPPGLTLMRDAQPGVRDEAVMRAD
jgi:hypothetical protein